MKTKVAIIMHPALKISVMPLLMNSNKEIYLLRLSITTKCILKCDYCFVHKNNKVISYPLATAAINFLLNSKGRKKILIIYGGEPLLYFNLVKQIISFAQKKAGLLKKSLIIALGTNGILLEQSHLDFFRKNKIKLAISLDGRESFHNKARVFPDRKGSFGHVIKKIPMILNNVRKEDICVLFGVLPSSIHEMYHNFRYLIKMGFNSINIEPIQSSQFEWSQEQKKVFLIKFIEIVKYIYANIRGHNFIFLNTINRELRNKSLSGNKKICPFFQNLEVYPHGEMAFSPFLINSKFKNRCLIGNIQKGLLEKYKFCEYDSKDEKCKNCWNDYKKNNFQDSDDWIDVYKTRDLYSIYLARKISELANENTIFNEYLINARKRIFE